MVQKCYYKTIGSPQFAAGGGLVSTGRLYALVEHSKSQMQFYPLPCLNWLYALVEHSKSNMQFYPLPYYNPTCYNALDQQENMCCTVTATLGY